MALLALSGCASVDPSPDLSASERDAMFTVLMNSHGVDIPAGVELPDAGRSICAFLESPGSSIDDLDAAFRNGG